MIKRDITETILEYDNEGKLLKKTVIETHEEEEEKITTSTYQTYPSLTNPFKFGPSDSTNIATVPYYTETHGITATNDLISNTTVKA